MFRTISITLAVISALIFTGCGDYTVNANEHKTPIHNQGAMGLNESETGSGDTIYIFMPLIEGGTFTMGCTEEQEDDCWDNENPAHQVTLSSFRIGKYPVTQELWRRVMSGNPSWFNSPRLGRNAEQNPVDNVSWYDAQLFISRLNDTTEMKFRLPTEAEWEFAARGGLMSRGYKYAGSDNINEIAWYLGNTGGKLSNGATRQVGTRAPNELNLYDMSGNVFEWVNDWYGTYTEKSKIDPQGPLEGINRVFRGGSWSVDAKFCRVSERFNGSPDTRLNIIGLRLALDPVEEEVEEAPFKENSASRLRAPNSLPVRILPQ
ncbi:MAG: formylglycine-generating enzyme family protein [Chitinispirillales bacterium]|jgi:formylglycine-generating enzyme required for sulfatase activity|nr:formylglycine-generating enzyme family protein [Chitinispirillales bacterium]